MNQNKQVSKNLFWRFLERCSAQGVALLVSIILARLLDPSLFGIIALVTVFTTILQVFVDSGLGNALIQKKDADDLDFSSVFFFNIFICTILYLLMFLIAPFIAKFYEKPELVAIIRVLSLTILISGVKNVQQAYVSRNMMFKRFFFATLGGTIGAAIVGIAMAYHGFGVWALVAQHLFNLTVDTIILWITVKWRPKMIFSFVRLKSLFSYGWKLLVSKLLDTIYNDLRQLIIGKLYSSADLAQYNQGKKYPQVIVSNINTSIDSVLLPTMSKAQDDPKRVKAMVRRSIKTSTYIMMPLMIGLVVCAEPIVSLLLTEKWLPCVPFLRIFCFAYAFQPIHTANQNAIKAMGRSDLFLKMDLAKKVNEVTLLLATIGFGVMAMAYSLLASTIINSFINAYPNNKLLGYHYFEQIKDMLPQIVLSCVMGILVYCITLLPLSGLVTLLIQVPMGAAIYLLGSWIFHIDSFSYIWMTLKNFLHRDKKETAP